MVSRLSVRVARHEDAASVERVLRQSYPALMTGFYEAALLARALPLMTRPNPKLLPSGTYYVAEAPSAVVGCGGWSLEQPGTASIEPGIGHIRHFATDAAWVGCGIGRAIYEQCEASARAAGVRQFQCYASRNAEPFYAALGFERLAAIALPIGLDVIFPCVHMNRPVERG